jgi:hypothetical protein
MIRLETLKVVLTYSNSFFSLSSGYSALGLKYIINLIVMIDAIDRYSTLVRPGNAHSSA